MEPLTIRLLGEPGGHSCPAAAPLVEPSRLIRDLDGRIQAKLEHLH